MWPVVMLLFGGGILFAKKGIKYVKNQKIILHNKKFFFPSSFNANLNIFLKNDLKGFERNMSKSEAYKILNINPTTNKEKIREVHKQLMLKNHPDNGGSTYIAAKVNEAKDVLLK
ncbi:mitochondrial import inner membrane translocase, putative [Plasmodium gallinaceum]|uniref:Mitochondrial import inner membrane translocase, putative n=1 Tax=Plasmodium gallinaceum TaxID=5849 RepID=A0A1J1GPK3_PLAGA|nr:mitochondrial import inner membrane translocase, putative [Plasmodium gallinaceum]CRG94431.1 mitochondrial import inner membrane translocase, putative [Plasmodium gallinaceum]